MVEGRLLQSCHYYHVHQINFIQAVGAMNVVVHTLCDVP